MTTTLDKTLDTRWWHTDPASGKVVCTLCPRECHIPEGSRGFCFVRANEGGRLALTTWGRSTGFCIDPIEKKPLNHFLPGTPVLSFGTAGCNLGCKFCQNWDISKSREIEQLSEIATPEAIVEAAEKTGSRSIAFTYNDPVIWAEYAIDVAKVAREHGIKTVAVTAGYISPDARREFYRWMDAANVDLKAFTETFYRKLCQTQLEPVLDTLKYLKRETNVWFELTNLMIPGENDSESETKAMCDWIVKHLGTDVPVHFTAFHPDFKMLDKPRTPHETLLRAREIAIDAGIEYAYVGNVNDVANQSTYCPGCKALLIERDWYELGAYRLDGNRCGACGHAIAGVFDPGSRHGDWGRKRLPIRIAQSTPAAAPGSDFVTITHMARKRQYKDPDQQAANPQAAAAKTEAAMSDHAPGAPRVPAGLRPSAPMPDPAIAVSLEAPTPKIDFTAEQTAALLRHARHVVEATVRRQPITSVLPVELADAPAYGMFVTLRRATALRACRGRWGNSRPRMDGKLGELLTAVAQDTATLDPRFPAITEAELPYLHLDISVMHDPVAVEAKGDERAKSVTVGVHGLVIAHPKGRGLLLPHVATDAGWDAPTFLDRTCSKAGLPPGAWKQDEAQLMTFRSRLLVDAPTRTELEFRSLNVEKVQKLFDAANKWGRGEPPEPPEATDQDDEVLSRKHEEELGVYLQTTAGLTAATIGPGHSLYDLVRIATQSLRDVAAQKKLEVDLINRITLLWQPVRLRPEDYPSRHGTLGASAVLARTKTTWALVVPGNSGKQDKVADALASLRISHDQWKVLPDIRLTAFSVLGFEMRQRPSGVTVRQPARAGQFYPGDAAEMTRQIDAFLGAAAPKKPYRAIMLPHAGWKFCGETLGKTLAKAEVPDTVIIIGPKHTPHGPPWSVASHQTWDIPGAQVPIATDVVDRLCQLVPNLPREAEAHKMEHGSEVLLPFLHRVNPKVRVVPMVLGQMAFEQSGRLAEALAKLVGEREASGERVLLVISSDMNHFANDEENRRLDKMALDAMTGGNPRELYETCARNDISMCGVVPAVMVMQALQKKTPAIAPELVDYTTSAKASGDASRVVGYAGVVIE